MDCHAAPDFNVHAASDEYGDSDTHPDAHCHAASNIDVNAAPDEHLHSHSDPYIHPDAVEHTDADAYCNTGSSHRDSDCHLDASAGDDQGFLHEHAAGR